MLGMGGRGDFRQMAHTKETTNMGFRAGAARTWFSTSTTSPDMPTLYCSSNAVKCALAIVPLKRNTE